MLHDPSEIEYYLKTGVLLQKVGMRIASSTATRGKNLNDDNLDEVCISKGQTVDVPFMALSYDNPSSCRALEINIVATLKPRERKQSRLGKRSDSRRTLGNSVSRSSLIEDDDLDEPSLNKDVIMTRVDIVPRYQDYVELVAADHFIRKGKLNTPTNLIKKFTSFILSLRPNFKGDESLLIDNFIVKSNLGHVDIAYDALTVKGIDVGPDDLEVDLFVFLYLPQTDDGRLTHIEDETPAGLNHVLRFRLPVVS